MRYGWPRTDSEAWRPPSWGWGGPDWSPADRDLLVLHSEDPGGLQSPDLVEVGQTEHFTDILHGETYDGRILNLSFHCLQ